MVLIYNLTLSNDTIALYISISACAMPSQTNHVRVWILSANAAAVADKGFHFVHMEADLFTWYVHPVVTPFPFTSHNITSLPYMP
jgi:hypothetical protein